ncbi:TOM1-like protein 6 [Lactuca sativa]|uniref:TOM1-like protein 6 n=1 Tax=Lactuca sativa TaxID=4236 RepID=UPI000CC793AE|nr:TOM1-like protein 6 [Lactuca sativa]
MMPMLPFSPSPSVISAYARVDKATSEFLNCPDWRINIGICDTINSRQWLAKDYIKALRTRLQHKNPNVQLLSLTLLETLVKNCSENIHGQMAERKILHEMIKIVKKKAHMRVREKILVLIDTWQEAFTGRGGKTAQYLHAYEELRRYGVDFPRRSSNSVPIITPPISHGHSQASSSSRHDPTASSSETLSFSTLDAMRSVMDVLSEMLQAVDPKDRMAVKDEVIVDLIDQCRSNQKKLGQMLASTTDEELLRQGLQFNDMLQQTVEKHDAIASGSPIPVNHPPDSNNSRMKQVENTQVNSNPIVHGEIEEEGNDSASMATRHNGTQNEEKPVADPPLTMAMVLSDPPPPPPAHKKSSEDMIDFLSITLSPASTSPSNVGQMPPDSPVLENQTQVPSSSYVVPWASTQGQPEFDAQVPTFQASQQQSDYIPPPWAPTPGYYCNPYSPTTCSGVRTASYYNTSPTGSSPGSGLNQYIPSYRLFEDLNVLGNVRTTGAPGTSGPSMVRK